MKEEGWRHQSSSRAISDAMLFVIISLSQFATVFFVWQKNFARNVDGFFPICVHATNGNNELSLSLSSPIRLAGAEYSFPPVVHHPRSRAPPSLWETAVESFVTRPRTRAINVSECSNGWYVRRGAHDLRFIGLLRHDPPETRFVNSLVELV